MEISVNDLIRSEGIISYNIPEDDSIYIASILGDANPNVESTIFFATNTNDQKWYASKSNRSILVKKLSKIKKRWVFVVEDTKLLANKSNYYILVHSVNLYIEGLTKRVLRNTNRNVIAITGSVGKTTLARLLSSLIDSSQLIDVKRLTPLNIADFVLNKLKPTTKYIIAEVGLYYSGQIEKLANILSPNIGVITNIYDMHIGWNCIRNRSNLLSEKLNLLKASQIRIVSKELFVDYADSHSLAQNNVICNYSDFIDVVNSCSNLPKTNVSINIIELVEIILNKCDCFNDNFGIDICQNIQENSSLLRLHKYTINGNDIFVDSHSSIAGYFQAISCHWYASVTLVILSLHFPVEENIENNILLIKQTFSSFSKVLISNKLIRFFGKLDNDKIQYIVDDCFLYEIQNEKIVIIHDPKSVRNSGKNENKWRSLTTAST